MSSILNSISSGGLRVQEAPGDTLKNDSIIDILKNSEIEFNTCPKLSNSLQHFNTGFDINNELYYKIPCSQSELKTPLYKENYLQEFVTEEDKARVRRALGLYNHDDVVSLSLLTTSDENPTLQAIKNASTKQMRKADEFFAPFTLTKAVYTLSGTTLDHVIKTINDAISKQSQEILNITQESKSTKLKSLGDITKFLNGFNNGDNLYDTIDSMNQEMLRFEKTDKINFKI